MRRPIVLLVLALVSPVALAQQARGGAGNVNGQPITPASVAATGAGTFTGSVSASGFNADGGTITTTATNSLVLSGNVSDGASAIGVKIQNAAALSTAGAKVAQFYSDNGTTPVAYVDKSGLFTTLGTGVRHVGTYLQTTTGDNGFTAAGVTAIGLPASPSIVNGGGTCTPATFTNDVTRPTVQLAPDGVLNHACGYAGPFTTVETGYHP